MGIIVLGRKYSIPKYLSVFMITAGTIICTFASAGYVVSIWNNEEEEEEEYNDVNGYEFVMKTNKMLPSYPSQPHLLKSLWYVLHTYPPLSHLPSASTYSFPLPSRPTGWEWGWGLWFHHLAVGYRHSHLRSLPVCENGYLPRVFVYETREAPTRGSLLHCKF